MTRRTYLLLLTLLTLCSLLAPLSCIGQGAPPFRTEDPETPGNRHLEINVGMAGNRNLSDGDYDLPSLDLAYGLGSRIQLKYELPWVLSEVRPTEATEDGIASPEHLRGGLGNSVLGAKLRFYPHAPGDSWLWHKSKEKREGAEMGEEEPTFAASIFPRIAISNPTKSVSRGVVQHGPNLLLPLELGMRLGPMRLNGEAGYQLGNHDIPQSWVRGLMLGHDFRRGTQAYVEVYDRQDANRLEGSMKRRDTSIEMGGRQPLDRHKRVLLLLMGGRSFQSVALERSQPSWVAYVGIRVVLGSEETRSEAIEPGEKKED